MSLFDIFALVLTLVSIFAYVNFKFLKLPTTVGVMVTALVLSTVLIVLNHFGLHYVEFAQSILTRIDFHETLMNGMLSFLLFAGAMHVKLVDLREQKIPIALLASVGVVISTIVIGYVTHLVLQGLDQPISLAYCMVFGALISPTDPIAVLSLIKQEKVPKSLEITIAGESLFNDGVGVVLFAMILQVASGQAELTFPNVLHLFFKEAVGGILFGLVIGYIPFLLLKSIDDYKVEVIITLALVTGGYSLAQFFHVSGPIAMVVAGLIIGNQGRSFAMSDITKTHVDQFWELIDEILNLALFVIIGLEVIVISYNQNILIAGLALVPVVLLGRLMGVSIPIGPMKRFRNFPRGMIPIMTWGGLRGGISVALALSLPAFEGRELIVGITYTIVVFSVVVQGLTFQKLLCRYKEVQGAYLQKMR